MIFNIETIRDKWGTKNHKIADYLIYDCQMPILGVKDGIWYFSENSELAEVLDKMPLWLKILGLFK